MIHPNPVSNTLYISGLGPNEEIKIYSLSVEDPEAENPTVNETLIKTLNINEENEYEFAIGYYKIKWTDDETDDPYLQDITLYICPKAPIVKMIVNGEELPDIDYKLKRKATIKIIGEETAETFYSINNSAFVKGDEFDIQSAGINYIVIVQIIDGYQSEALALYITYNPPNTMGWIIYIAGVAIFALLFYLAIRFYPALVKFHIGKNNGGSKKNLD